MKRILGILAVLILAASAQAGSMFASLFANRAAPAVSDTYFTVSFVTGTPPTNIVLHADYTGPATPAQALYDAGDGVWRAYTANNITMRGDRRYLKLRGDWRTAAGTYKGMFRSALAGAAYTCEFTGTLDYAATAARAYQEIFRDCTQVTAIRHNPFQPIRGSPAVSMFDLACYGMSGVTGSLPAGFLDTSGLTGSPAANMFYLACNGMSKIASGDFNISTNVTLTSANIVGPLTSAWRGMTLWTGQVYWGTNVIHTVLTPDSDINTFAGNTNMPGYAGLNANWK